MNAAELPACADCECGHPRGEHTSGLALACMATVPGRGVCACGAFKAAESKLSQEARCYCCGSAAHRTGFCPYVKGRKQTGW